MEDPKTKQTGKQISSPIHRSISSMVSPELWDHLWPHSQDEMVNHFRTMNNQVSGQMGAAIRQQMMLVVWHSMREQICAQMDKHTQQEMKDIWDQ